MPQLRSEQGTLDVAPNRVSPQGAEGTAASAASLGKLKPGPGKPGVDVERHQRARIHSALVELVAKQGYDAVTVRDLSQTAGVSTRTFYQHYSSKEKCFLRVQELIGRQILRAVAASQAGAQDRESRMWLAANALVRAWEACPKAAHLMLVDAYAAGPRALAQARAANRSIEARIGMYSASDSTAIPPLLIEGIVAGLASVTRSRLLSAQARSSVEVADDLGRWAISCWDPLAARLEQLDRAVASESRDADSFQPASSSMAVGGEGGASAPSGDMALLLSAAAKLVATTDAESITPEKILATAGVPRRSFSAHFSSGEDCVAAAVELHTKTAISRAKRAGRERTTPEARVCRMVSSLCVQIASDPTLASLCFGETNVRGVRKMRCEEQFIAELGRPIEGELLRASTGHSDELMVEASVGAMLGVLQRQVTAGRFLRAPQIAPTLSYLILAPMVGALPAIEAIRKEPALA